MIPKHYLEIKTWLTKQKQSHVPLIVGLNAPQGAGKTTLCKFLSQEFKLVSISIDDFYLTRTQQKNLALKHPSNRYLQQRGYPGTHDIELGTSLLSRIKSQKTPIKIPRYDKAAHGGLGDRLPQAQWTQVETVPDIVILEGWMLGFSPLPENNLDKEFAEINNFLKAYSQWHQFLDAFIHFVPEDINFVIAWRIEAEQKMRDQGRGAMTDEEIKKYIELFLPAYQFFLPILEKNYPVENSNLLRGTISKNRDVKLEL